MSYFHQVNATTFRPTQHVGGAWSTTEQHIGPAFALMLHQVDVDHHARRADSPLVASRLSYDIFGTVPMEDVSIDVAVVRPGRTIELVEATLSHGGRMVVLLRAWLVRSGDTAALAGSDLPRIPGPDDMPAWDPTSVWDGGYIAAAEVRRNLIRPGRAVYWVRSSVCLLDSAAGHEVGHLAHMARLFDIANGMSVRVSPREVAFPNLDLTAHLFRQPAGEWLGFDTTVSFGATGHGLTSTILHDAEGPFGTLAQILTVRP